MVRGIISCFRRKSGFDLRFSSQIPLFQGKPVFQVDWLDAKFHHEQCAKRLLYFRERLLYFGERLLYVGEGRLYFEERCLLPEASISKVSA